MKSSTIAFRTFLTLFVAGLALAFFGAWPGWSLAGLGLATLALVLGFVALDLTIEGR